MTTMAWKRQTILVISYTIAMLLEIFKNDFECEAIKANYFYIVNNRLWCFYFVKQC